jgi:PD-(D/E)XK endonuclease
MPTPREQGDIGELSAMYWLASRGASVAVPIGNSRHWDLIAELDGRLLRVQVKTTTLRRHGRWQAALCTRGGNRSWNGLSKLLDTSRCDYVFVLVGDGRQWFIPSGSLGGTSAIVLGGPKYAAFEVEQGEPIEHPRSGRGASTIASLTPRGDVRVAKGMRL